MAFKFNAILAFNWDQAKGELKRAETGFKSFKDNVSKANESLGNIRMGMAGGAAALAPLTWGVGLATKTAGEFEQAMSNVQAVLLATKEEMAPLEEVTKILGATTVFTAKEAAEGAKFLAQAGFNMQEVVAALPGVLDAAAASEMELGDAARIVSSNVRSFGLEASKATEVADIMALTTSLTNTTMIELGEATKLSAPILRGAGLTFASTASALGVLANAGVRGTLAGTALKNAIVQLSNPTKEVLGFFGGQGGLNEAVMEFRDGAFRLRPMEVIMANISKVVLAAKNPLEAAGMAADIFGLRGVTAAGAFEAQFQDTADITEKNIAAIRRGIELTGEGIEVNLGDKIPKLVAIRLAIAGAAGTAKEMATIRLDNFFGSIELLRGAIEGLSLEIGGMLLGPLKQLALTVSEFTSVVVIGFQVAKQGVAATDKQLESLEKNRFKGLLGATTEFAAGFIDGFKEMKSWVISTFETIADWMQPFLGDAKLSAKELGNIASKIIFIGAALGPVLAATAGFLFVMGPIISGITGFFGLMSSMWGMVSSGFVAAKAAIGGIALALGAPVWGVLAIGAAIVGAIAAIWIFRDEIASFATSAYQSVVNFFTNPLGTSFRELGAEFGKVGEFIGAAFDIIATPAKVIIATLKKAGSLIANGFFDPMSVSFTEMGAQLGTFGTLVGYALDAITFPIKLAVSAFTVATKAIFDVFVKPLIGWFNDLQVSVQPILDKINEKFGQFMGIVDSVVNSPIGQAIGGFVTEMASDVQSVFQVISEAVIGTFDGTFRGFLGVMKAMGSVIANIFKQIIIDPIVNTFSWLQYFLGQLVSFIPNSMLEKLGLSNAQLQQFIGTDIGVQFENSQSNNSEIGSALKVNQDTAAIANESLRTKALVQPPSAEAVAEATRTNSSGGSSSQESSSSSQQTVKVIVEGKIRGNDLNLVQTKAAVSQAERNGRMIDPGVKRRLLQNGAAVTP